jgi:hypothetical protein
VEFLLPLPLSYSQKKIGVSRKGIGNLNGFEYCYLNGPKVPYFSTYPPLSIKVTYMGTTVGGASGASRGSNVSRGQAGKAGQQEAIQQPASALRGVDASR